MAHVWGNGKACNRLTAPEGGAELAMPYKPPVIHNPLKTKAILSYSSYFHKVKQSSKTYKQAKHSYCPSTLASFRISQYVS